MQDKQSTNAQEQPHGFWERYWDNGKLCYKGEYINGQPHGPWISYYNTGQLCYKRTYNMGQRDGIFEWYDEDGSIQEISFYAR